MEWRLTDRTTWALMGLTGLEGLEFRFLAARARHLPVCASGRSWHKQLCFDSIDCASEESAVG